MASQILRDLTTLLIDARVESIIASDNRIIVTFNDFDESYAKHLIALYSNVRYSLIPQTITIDI